MIYSILGRVSNRSTKLKLDKSPAALQQFDLNMRKVYLVLLRRFNFIQRQGVQLAIDFGVINPGIILNKNLATADISHLNDEAICEQADASPEFATSLRFPLRTLPIAASIITKLGMTRISFRKLKKVFDKAHDVNLDLMNKGLPPRAEDNRIRINTEIIKYLVKVGLWKFAKINHQNYLVNEFGFKIGKLSGGKIIETDKGYVWSK